MRQRGSNRLNVHRDDEMKHELQGMLRGDHPTRAEEWREAEPAADDDPELVDGPVRPRNVVDEEESDREAFRHDLARHLRRSVFPAKRRELLVTLFETHASERLVDAVRELPPGHTYGNVQEVTDALGRGPRS
ncbi:DUF2795 domain-containing protein [Streptomyces radicis]|uniref:DUF2795 domain-containing protein n=1 Tax=Streptomyces radicis TaxID=1750517 RepID=A0A3A9WIP5_9ACTN|nr:DUF2795 domain-containing protein [Streptomyces radicis]RKN12183.1 DUF2795 domain-containing protein [Streptomyces radicis]RKN25764.1 DUF2795 domain-containing protein [Streptomyces radicis]